MRGSGALPCEHIYIYIYIYIVLFKTSIVLVRCYDNIILSELIRDHQFYTLSLLIHVVPWPCEVLIIGLVLIIGFQLGFQLVCPNSDKDCNWRTKKLLFAFNKIYNRNRSATLAVQQPANIKFIQCRMYWTFMTQFNDPTKAPRLQFHQINYTTGPCSPWAEKPEIV